MSFSQTSSSSSKHASKHAPAAAPQGPRPFAAMSDVVCGVDVILGTGHISVRDCLKLQRMSVVRLGQSAGSDLEVRVHGVTAATGEVVIVDDSTAIRVTEIAPPPGGENFE